MVVDPEPDSSGSELGLDPVTDLHSPRTAAARAPPVRRARNGRVLEIALDIGAVRVNVRGPRRPIRVSTSAQQPQHALASRITPGRMVVPRHGGVRPRQPHGTALSRYFANLWWLMPVSHDTPVIASEARLRPITREESRRYITSNISHESTSVRGPRSGPIEASWRIPCQDQLPLPVPEPIAPP